jgi:hypothetical protein
MFKKWRRLCRWLVFNVPMGPLAPHVMHMSFPGKVTMKKIKEQDA